MIVRNMRQGTFGYIPSRHLFVSYTRVPQQPFARFEFFPPVKHEDRAELWDEEVVAIDMEWVFVPRSEDGPIRNLCFMALHGDAQALGAIEETLKL